MAGLTAGLQAPREPYSADFRASRGRLYGEPPSHIRTPFQRDGDRITHSTAFRRLRDKTQVFLAGEGDHFRTRLTHTLEVTRIARTLARALGLDEDLAEAVALAHDLGHPPFGHAGERALGAAMAAYGGFDHNIQSFRIVTLLERRYPRFDGLNLTWEVLEGIAKHNGPLTDRNGQPLAGTPAIGPRGYEVDLWLWSQPSLEAQVAALADDIAYAAHDIDDGLRAGLLTPDGLGEVAIVGDIERAVVAEYPGLERPRFAHELGRRLLTKLIDDVLVETKARIGAAAPRSSDDVRRASRPLAAFSETVAVADRALKEYLAREVYRHPSVMIVMRSGEAVVRRLFARYRQDPMALPEAWRPPKATDLERTIADFLAGMTDRYALLEYERFFGLIPEMR